MFFIVGINTNPAFILDKMTTAVRALDGSDLDAHVVDPKVAAQVHAS